MIRLSEAIARANCTEEITPTFVSEAYDLLRQSIIRVEMDDIEMDDDADNAVASNNAEEEDRPEEVPDQTDDRTTSSAGPSRPKKESVAISYDKYVAMMNLLVKKISDDDSDGGEGLTAEQIVNWYLTQKEDDIQSEQEYYNERKLCYKVLKRLVKDRILMSVTNSLDENDQLPINDQEELPRNTRTVYILHPNCAILDFFDQTRIEEPDQEIN